MSTILSHWLYKGFAGLEGYVIGSLSGKYTTAARNAECKDECCLLGLARLLFLQLCLGARTGMAVLATDLRGAVVVQVGMWQMTASRHGQHAGMILPARWSGARPSRVSLVLLLSLASCVSSKHEKHPCQSRGRYQQPLLPARAKLPPARVQLACQTALQPNAEAGEASSKAPWSRRLRMSFSCRN